MAFGSFESDGVAQPMAEINTTPLVDVMLVLLVIFIITAPLFQQAVPVDLPQAEAKKLDEKPMIIAVTIDRDGMIYLDGARQQRSSLPESFSAAMRNHRPPELHLRADRGTRYEHITEVVAAAQQAGIVRIAFVMAPE